VYFFNGPGIGHSDFNLGAGEDIRWPFPLEGFSGIDPIHPVLHEPLACLDSLSFENFLLTLDIGLRFISDLNLNLYLNLAFFDS
jgi:hypothetical protein